MKYIALAIALLIVAPSGEQKPQPEESPVQRSVDKPQPPAGSISSGVRIFAAPAKHATGELGRELQNPRRIPQA